MFVTIRSGRISCDDAALNRCFVTVISMAAGTPLPDTSPIQKNKCPSRIKKSNRSPPTAFAGVSRPKRSRSRRSGNGGNFFGSIDFWMLPASSNSRPIAAWEAVVIFNSSTYCVSDCCMCSKELWSRPISSSLLIWGSGVSKFPLAISRAERAKWVNGFVRRVISRRHIRLMPITVSSMNKATNFTSRSPGP